MHRLSVLALVLAACAGGTATETEEPRSVTTWAIQLQGIEDPGAVNRLARADADLLVIEAGRTVRGSEAFPTAAVVSQLHASRERRLVLAYVNVGQAEDYRTYWRPAWRAPTPEGPGDPSFLLATDPDGWPGNYPVAFWDARWRPVLYGRSTSLVDRAIDDGFDGVMLDWVGGWEDERVAAVARRAGVDPATAMVDLIRELATYARAEKPGFMVLPLNAAGLARARPDLLDTIDGVIQESVTFAGAASATWSDPTNADTPIPAEGDWSTATFVRDLTAVRRRGLLVLTLDYATRPENIATARALARKHGFLPFVSRTPLSRLP
jgi:cysteinyl-tRNA synthetase, unknown class